MTKMEMLNSWLNDAYAMEEAKADLLKRYSEDVEEYPDIKEIFDKGAEKATTFARALKEIMDNMGKSASGTKKVVGKMGSMFQSMTSELMHDQIIKHM